jgi:hypothetical protein
MHAYIQELGHLVEAVAERLNGARDLPVVGLKAGRSKSEYCNIIKQFYKMARSTHIDGVAQVDAHRAHDAHHGELTLLKRKQPLTLTEAKTMNTTPLQIT